MGTGLEPPDFIVNPTGTLSHGTQPHQGIPSIAVSADGKRVFCAWYGGSVGENSFNYAMMASSADQGNTWSDVKWVVRSPYCGQVRVFDPALWRDPSGQIWFFWAQSGGGQHWDRRGGVWASVCADPSAKEVVWSPPRRLADGLMMNKPIALSTGRWLYPVGMVSKNPHINDEKTLLEGVYCYASDDQGKTLTLLSRFQVPNPGFPEHMFVEKKNGDIWALVRRNAANIVSAYDSKKGVLVVRSGVNSGIAEALSQDGGKTWGKVMISPIPSPTTRFYIGRLKSGNLLLVKNPAGDEGWLAKKKDNFLMEKCLRNRLLAYLSLDDGKTWKGPLELDERAEVSYPDANQDDAGTIFVCYDRERTKEHEILCARFTEADILEGKIVSSDSKLKILVNKGTTDCSANIPPKAGAGALLGGL